MGLARPRFRDEADGSAGPVALRHRPPRAAGRVRRGASSSRPARASGPRGADREPAAVEPTRRWLEGLDEALATCPPAQRDAIRLRIVDDLGYDEAADRLLDVSPEVLARASRAGFSTLRTPLPTRRRHHDDEPLPLTWPGSATSSSEPPPPTLRVRTPCRPGRAGASRAGSWSRSRRPGDPVPGVAIAADQLTSTTRWRRACPQARSRSPAPSRPARSSRRTSSSTACSRTPPAPEVSDWKGTVEPTVDATSHVNGGCRSLVERRQGVGVLPRPEGRRRADHRPGLPGRVLVRPRRRLTLWFSGGGCSAPTPGAPTPAP